MSRLDWKRLDAGYPPKQRWVLMWSERLGGAVIAKWDGRQFRSSAHALKTKDLTHWAEVIGPDGKVNRYAGPGLKAKTYKESQDNGVNPC